MSSYLREICVKVPSEKENKICILLDLLLDYIKERTEAESLNIDDFIETIMKIFESKIF